MGFKSYLRQPLKDCQNDRIKTSMKQSFDESSYAQTYHLKAVIIETKQKKARQGYLSE